MTVALAMRGCSLLELHAAYAADVSHDKEVLDDVVKDVFFVVDRVTGKPYGDDELEDLAKALLESVQTPMNVLGVKAATAENEKLEPKSEANLPTPEEQITIIPSTAK